MDLSPPLQSTLIIIIIMHKRMRLMQCVAVSRAFSSRSIIVNLWIGFFCIPSRCAETMRMIFFCTHKIKCKSARAEREWNENFKNSNINFVPRTCSLAVAKPKFFLYYLFSLKQHTTHRRSFPTSFLTHAFWIIHVHHVGLILIKPRKKIEIHNMKSFGRRLLQACLPV